MPNISGICNPFPRKLKFPGTLLLWKHERRELFNNVFGTFKITASLIYYIYLYNDTLSIISNNKQPEQNTSGPLQRIDLEPIAHQ